MSLYHSINCQFKLKERERRRDIMNLHCRYVTLFFHCAHFIRILILKTPVCILKLTIHAYYHHQEYTIQKCNSHPVFFFICECEQDCSFHALPYEFHGVCIHFSKMLFLWGFKIQFFWSSLIFINNTVKVRSLV